MIIGLTGGIASGKSTVATTLQGWGAYVIDADKLGHRAYVKGTDAFHKVVAQFGEDIVGADGEVDRRALGAKVFGEGGSLKQLTDIVWPAIYDMAWQSLVDEIWVNKAIERASLRRSNAKYRRK